MKPKDFKESNLTLTRPNSLSDLECGSLKVYRDNRQCVSLWKANLRERLSILFFGNVWLSVHGSTQPPIWIDAMHTVFEQPPFRVRVAGMIDSITNRFKRRK